MKVALSVTLVCLASCLVWSHLLHADGPGVGPRVGKPAIMRQSDDFDPLTRRVSTSAGTATDFDYSTDFEAPNFVARDATCVQDTVHCTPFTGECGWIHGQDPGPYPKPWVVTPSNQGVGMIEGHIDNVNPFSGQQHLRLSKDRCPAATREFWDGVDARIPASPPLPGVIGPSTYSGQIALTHGLYGANVNWQPQSNSQGLLTSRTLFFFYGFFYILDDPGTGLTFVPVFSYWDATGGHQEIRVTHDPCRGFICIDNGSGTPTVPGGPCTDDSGCRACVGGASDTLPCLDDFQCPGGTCNGGDCVGRIDYWYDVDGDGQLTEDANPLNNDLVYSGSQYAGTSSEQFLIYTDNFPGDTDLDDLVIETGEPCPFECGNLIIETGEQCDGANDSNCPGRCVPPGAVGPAGEVECNCVIIGGAEPTELPNGTVNVVSHGGWWTFVADAPAYAVDTCGSTGYDSALAAYTGTLDSLALIKVNEDCDVNSSYSYGNADPLAPCHPVRSPWEACLCIATNIGQRYWIQDYRTTLGGTTNITLSKRLDCGAIWENGACCDRVTGTCTDEVASVDCTGLGQVFTLAKFCVSVTCEAAMGACCDESPGSGGACADGVLKADCQGQYNVWTIDTLCVDAPACQEVTGACCDGFTGTCSITLAADCQGQNQAWTAGATCVDVTCDPIPGACCNTINPDPIATEGVCTDGVIQAACTGTHLIWTKGDTCSNVDCPAMFQAIPTVSEWGLVVLALALLVFAKLRFGYLGETSRSAA